MKLYCPLCGIRISSDCINLDNLAAKCSCCDQFFGFSAKLEDDRDRGCDYSLIISDERPALPCPPRMRAKDAKGVLAIRWTWRNDLWLTPLTLVCIAFNGLLILDWSSKGGLPTPDLWFLIALGLASIYIVLAGYYNSSTLRATHNYLEIEHAPLPWPNRELSRHKIAHLYCHSNSKTIGNTPTKLWQLCARLISGRKVRLANRLTFDEAQFLKQTLEDHLYLPTESTC